MKQQITKKLEELLKDSILLHGDGHELPDRIDPDVNFYETYDIDSLTGVGFFIEVQRTFKLRIPEERARVFRSLSEISDYLVDRFRQVESKV